MIAQAIFQSLPGVGKERCPPKAKVVCSNHAGRANKINDLRNSFRRRAKGKLTINSPTERTHSRAIGGNLAGLLPWTRPRS